MSKLINKTYWYIILVRGGRPTACVPYAVHFMLLNGTLTSDKITCNLTGHDLFLTIFKVYFFNIIYLKYIYIK